MLDGKQGWGGFACGVGDLAVVGKDLLCGGFGGGGGGGFGLVGVVAWGDLQQVVH